MRWNLFLFACATLICALPGAPGAVPAPASAHRAACPSAGTPGLPDGLWAADTPRERASASAAPAAPPRTGTVKARRSPPATAQVYRRGWLRIVYQTRGLNAVNPRDANRNNIPDLVEDAALQLLAARHVFCDLYGFRDPLASPLYPRVTAVAVRILHRQNMRRAHGLAFSAPIPLPGGPKDELALEIRMAKDLRVSATATLVHEYFHLIQYGMSRFSANWHSEGMARWAENALAVRALAPTSYPDPRAALRDAHFLEVLQTTSYTGASMLWNPLSLACDRDGALPLAQDDPLPNLRYSDGTPVLKDRLFPGAPLIRRVLETLAAQEAAAMRQGRLDAKALRAPASFPYLLRAVRDSVDAYPGCRRETAE